MLIAIGYHKGDLDQAERLADRMSELGPYTGHSILVARDNSTDAQPFLNVGFDNHNEIVITDDIWKKWSESPNNVFRKLAVYIEYTCPQPWLLLEPDVALIRKGWLDELAAAYKQAFVQGKFFLGAFVPGFIGKGHDGNPVPVPDHMSGIAVYPGEMKTYAGKATLALEVPWDIEGAEQIVPQAHFTKLIQHNWRRPSFETWEELAAELDPAAVIYHSDKSGSVVKLLRERENLSSGVESRHAGYRQATSVTDENPRGSNQMPSRASDENSDDHSGSSAPPAQIPSPEVGERWLTPNGWRYWDGTEWAKEYPFTHKDLEAAAAVLVPWHSKKESINQIQNLCAELKTYCTAPMHTSRVRKELKAAGVIKKL